MMPKSRLYWFYGIFIIGFLLLAGRLFELQIIFGQKNRAIADGNRIKKIIEPAPRGMIYDRSGREVVRNIPIYKKCIAVDKCQILAREEALKLEAQNKTEDLRLGIGRDYLYGKAVAHVLGYLGEAGEAEVGSGEYELGDLVGRTGVEEKYNTVLNGQSGGELIEVDSLGNKIREIGKIAPVSGKDLFLSVDAELSRTAYEAMEGRAGAVVASEAKTGRILALVSSPSFNPNEITSQSLNDPTLPFFNRAIGGAYPPGSTFKIVTATAGLEEGKIDAKTIFEDTGQIRVGDFVYKNWYFTQYGKTEGKINLVRAIKRSTDTFFYKVGEWVGPQKLAEWGRVFGLGKKTGIELPGEVGGLVPDPEWKQQNTGERWFLGNTYHFAIGQADLLTTPLQINMMTGVIANNGKLCQPTVLQGSESQCQDLKLKTETLELIKEGMKGVCSTGGTAFPFFDFTPAVACKTGTAEFGDPKNRTHAWLTAFAPVDDPQIVVTVLVEAGGEGSYVAAPIAKKILEVWFNH